MRKLLPEAFFYPSRLLLGIDTLLCMHCFQIMVQLDPSKVEANWFMDKFEYCSWCSQLIRSMFLNCFALHRIKKDGNTLRGLMGKLQLSNSWKRKMASLTESWKYFVGQYDSCGNNWAVFMQNGQVLAYEMRALSWPKKAYQVYQKEVFAVIHAF